MTRSWANDIAHDESSRVEFESREVPSTPQSQHFSAMTVEADDEEMIKKQISVIHKVIEM